MVVQCRACLNSKDAEYVQMDSPIPIAEDLDFFGCFTLCTQLNAERHDGLPGVLCTNCSQDLQVAYNFVQNAREADTLLRNNLQLPKSISGEEVVEFLADVRKVSEADAAVLNAKYVSSEGYIVEELVLEESNSSAIMNEKDAGEAVEFDNRDEILFAHELDQLEFVAAKRNTTNSAIKYDPEDDVLDDLSSSIPEYCTEDENDKEFLPEYDKEATDVQNPKHNLPTKSSKWKCIECKRLLSGDVSYESHMNMHHCRITLERHQQLRHQVTAHAKEENIENTLKCDKCTQIFATHEELQEHHELVHPEYSHQLIQCDDNNSSKEAAKDFPQSTTTTSIPSNAAPVERTLWKCDVCKRYLYSEVALELHRNTHTDLNKQRTHECEFCEKRFGISSNLRRHIRNVHYAEYVKLMNSPGEELVECETCNKRYRRKNLDKHMATHRKKEPKVARSEGPPSKFLCAYCSREFSNKSHLNQHEYNVHVLKMQEPQYACDTCERKFYREHDYIVHKQYVHLAEKNHTCDVCGNAFKNKKRLAEHKKRHDEKCKTFKCNFCQRKYIRQAELNIHMRFHTGEMPYECHLCDRRFSVKSRLTYHLQQHEGVKHTCTYCDSVFETREAMKRHLFKHTGMPYRCEICPDVGFPRRKRFADHMRRIHGQILSNEELSAIFTKNTGRAVHFNTDSTAEIQRSGESQSVDDYMADNDK